MQRTSLWKHSCQTNLNNSTNEVLLLCFAEQAEQWLLSSRDWEWDYVLLNFTRFHSLFSAAFLLLGCLPTASASGKAAIRGNFVVDASPAASLAFDDDLISASSLHVEAEVATFSFLRADVLDPLPVAGVCSSNGAFQ